MATPPTVTGEEFRFEVGFKDTVEIRLKSGKAEYFGAELAPEAKYAFSGDNGAIFSWQGCTLSVQGQCQSAYVAGETPMDSYINVHMALQQLRVQAHNGDLSVAPRVMLVGPEDSGKTSLARLLVNYAVRMGERPLFVDLDPSLGSVTVPGTVSATAMGKTVDPESGFMGCATSSSDGVSDVPLVLQFGHEQPDDNTMLFKILVDRLAASIDARMSADNFAAGSGLVVDTRGFTDVNKYDTIEHAVAALRITALLVVGNERMYSIFSTRLQTQARPVTVLRLTKSGGTVDRNATYRRQLNDCIIRQYFNGTAKEPLASFPAVVNFQDVTILRVGEDVRAPSSTLPLGEIRKLTETTVFTVEPDEALSHSVLAVTDAQPPVDGEDDSDGVVGVQALGFVNVTKVDMEKKRFTMSSPVPGRLPKKVLVYGHIKWMETL
ncbi:Cleavage polyadenylation factor subunit clp1 [Kickxella alabastrina]|uniref:Cleavage polyadenylation factor subunit clp1 n=1 Tax=Kickxella alabastrina TaxID=61397 RepID=A0ACC1IVU8_9FUNG|nr:Cleavage polyadenylation factor subunit clp1 [Kickxella alabastrina]